MSDDNEIINRARSGDLKAFEFLVKKYQKLVFTVIDRLTQNKSDVEDICQEVFIKVHKGLKSFAFYSKFSTWIARIAYLTAINYLKKMKREQTIDYPENLDNYHFTQQTPEEITVRKDVLKYIYHLIDEMPEQFKLVFTLYHTNDFSYREIEEITGMPEGTVKGYLYRARKLLKEKLEDYVKKERI